MTREPDLVGHGQPVLPATDAELAEGQVRDPAAPVPIASLRASGQTDGHTTIAGRITAAELRTSGAGVPWTVLTITDPTGTIDVHLMPTSPGLHTWPREGDQVTATGWLCVTGSGLVIYGTHVAKDGAA